MVSETEPQAPAEQSAGAEQVVCEAEAEREGMERERVRQGERGVEAGQRGRRGGREEERDGRVQRGRAASVEGDEGRDHGGGRGEAARHDEVRVEREEQARGRRGRAAGEDGVERDAHRRHLPASGEAAAAESAADRGSTQGFARAARIRNALAVRSFAPTASRPYSLLDLGRSGGLESVSKMG